MSPLEVLPLDEKWYPGKSAPHTSRPTYLATFPGIFRLPAENSTQNRRRAEFTKNVKNPQKSLKNQSSVTRISTKNLPNSNRPEHNKIQPFYRLYASWIRSWSLRSLMIIFLAKISNGFINRILLSFWPLNFGLEGEYCDDEKSQIKTLLTQLSLPCCATFPWIVPRMSKSLSHTGASSREKHRF